MMLLSMSAFAAHRKISVANRMLAHILALAILLFEIGYLVVAAPSSSIQDVFALFIEPFNISIVGLIIYIILPHKAKNAFLSLLMLVLTGYFLFFLYVLWAMWMING